MPAEFYESTCPTVDLRYLLSEQANGELWLISLPDGKRARLPQVLANINPGILEIQLSYDGKQAVFLKGQPDTRLVLIDHLFK